MKCNWLWCGLKMEMEGSCAGKNEGQSGGQSGLSGSTFTKLHRIYHSFKAQLSLLLNAPLLVVLKLKSILEAMIIVVYA